MLRMNLAILFYIKTERLQDAKLKIRQIDLHRHL